MDKGSFSEKFNKIVKEQHSTRQGLLVAGAFIVPFLVSDMLGFSNGMMGTLVLGGLVGTAMKFIYGAGITSGRLVQDPAKATNASLGGVFRDAVQDKESTKSALLWGGGLALLSGGLTVASDGTAAQIADSIVDGTVLAVALKAMGGGRAALDRRYGFVKAENTPK